MSLLEYAKIHQTFFKLTMDTFARESTYSPTRMSHCVQCELSFFYYLTFFQTVTPHDLQQDAAFERRAGASRW